MTSATAGVGITNIAITKQGAISALRMAFPPDRQSGATGEGAANDLTERACEAQDLRPAEIEDGLYEYIFDDCNWRSYFQILTISQMTH